MNKLSKFTKYYKNNTDYKILSLEEQKNMNNALNLIKLPPKPEERNFGSGPSSRNSSSAPLSSVQATTNPNEKLNKAAHSKTNNNNLPLIPKHGERLAERSNGRSISSVNGTALATGR